MNFMNENSQIIIPLLGVITAFLAWLQLRTQSRIKDKDAKLETIENTQIKIQAEADKMRSETEQRKSELNLLRETVANAFKSDERWQQTTTANNDKIVAVIERLDTTLDRTSQRTIDSLAATTGMMEIVSTQLGNNNEFSKRAEEASLQTLKIVTEKTAHIQQEITELKRELIDIRETQDSHITSAGTRHTENNIKFARITETLGTMESELAGIRALLQPLPPTPPANEIPLNQPENTETENKKSA